MLPGKVRRAIARYGLLERGDRVIVGVSGGPDSMALLHALHVIGREERWQVFAAHLHHGLRGCAADLDLALVEEYADRWGVPLFVERLAPDTLRGGGLEASARRERYAFFRRVADESGAARTATAHTMDDQAETVLLRLLRGSGTRGLAGIRPRRADGVIRPLLLATRADVIAYLRCAGVAFREDETNRDPRFLRNRVRREVLPLLRTLSPQITERLATLAERLRADEEFLEAEAARMAGDVVTAGRRGADDNAGPVLNRARLSKLPEAIRSRVLLSLLAGAGAAPDRVSDAIDRISEHLAPDAPPGGLDVGGSLRVRWDAKGVRVEGAQNRETAQHERHLLIPGTTALADGREVRATILDGADAAGIAKQAAGEPNAPAQALFDLADLPLPLSLRTRRPGDRMRPRGFGQWRKLKDVLIDARVPREARSRVPLVVTGDEILWAAGVRASERGRPTAATKRVLMLELLEFDEGGGRPPGGRPAPTK